MSRLTLSLWLVLVLLSGLLPWSTAAQPVFIESSGFADTAFENLWTRTDQPVAENTVSRSWVWGERPAMPRYERYLGVPEGVRLVQYFDKARMEINDPAGDRASPWFVTNGLLVVEMIRGQIQVDETRFEDHDPADIPLAGDPVDNPDAPTYAALSPVASTDGNNAAAQRTGERVRETFGPQEIAPPDSLITSEVELVRYEATTGHNVPRVFEAFMNAQGPVLVAGNIQPGAVVDALFAFGYPITEPYWARVRVGGQQQWVLFQAFQRRVLTYNPANPPDWQVEMGNVGQHYMRWRYGQPMAYAQPPVMVGVRAGAGSIDIPTYNYEQALIPTEPDDPIYPYPRLDWSQVGPPEMRTYETRIVENQFLRLVFLPELGGRFYQMIDKATGQNLFYQNPVIKPSPFGQRGWWLGVGGMEWAVPTEEHGYLEYQPWESEIDVSRRGNAAAVDRMGWEMLTTEQQTGMDVSGFVALFAGESRIQVRLRVVNDTDQAHPLQMWTNAMLAPGEANQIEDDLHFVVPSDRLIVHAAEDSRVPAPQELIDWPEWQGIDMHYPANWDGYVGAFAPDPVPFFGVYDSNQDAGLAIVPGADAVGAKIFGFSRDFDRSMFTDDGSDYVELWSGAQTTFWDYPPLEPDSMREINAEWLPLRGLGDLVMASADGALGASQRADGGTTVVLTASRILPDAVVVVQFDGQEVFRSAPLDVRPDQPLAIDLPFDARGGTLRVAASDLIFEYQTER